MKIQEFLKEDITNPTDTITVDVPLFIRLLEYAREDAETDIDLHNLTERIISLAASGQTLTMADYESIAGGEISECTSGATGSGAVATSIGGGAGFGKSIFMRRNPTPKKSKK